MRGLQPPGVQSGAIEPARAEERVVDEALGAGEDRERPQRRPPPSKQLSGAGQAPLQLADAGTAKRERRRRPAVAARQLRLIGDAAMLDAIGVAGVGLLAAEMEVGLAGMAHRPFADAVVELEQAGLVGDFGARLGRDQAARRGRRDRRLRVAGALADEAAGTDRAILDIVAGFGCGRCGDGGRRRGRGRAPARRQPGASRAGPARLGGLRRGGGGGLLSSPGLTGEGRASRPRRCALPMTALRLTPPSSSAIWLAVAPSAHIAFRRSIRSSVQDMQFLRNLWCPPNACCAMPQPIGGRTVNDQLAKPQPELGPSSPRASRCSAASIG